MPQNTYDKSTLIWVMAWCHQASSHYLSQCWPSVATCHDDSTHWDMKKMANILQTTFSNASSLEKIWAFQMETYLTHWGRETHICVGKLTIIASDNGLLPGRRQAIIWTNAGILLIGPLGTNFNEILIEIHTISSKKMHLKMSAKWHPFCLGLNVLSLFLRVPSSQYMYWFL